MVSPTSASAKPVSPGKPTPQKKGQPKTSKQGSKATASSTSITAFLKAPPPTYEKIPRKSTKGARTSPPSEDEEDDEGESWVVTQGLPPKPPDETPQRPASPEPIQPSSPTRVPAKPNDDYIDFIDEAIQEHRSDDAVLASEKQQALADAWSFHTPTTFRQGLSLQRTKRHPMTTAYTYMTKESSALQVLLSLIHI